MRSVHPKSGSGDLSEPATEKGITKRSGGRESEPGVFVGTRIRLRPVNETDLAQLMEWDSDGNIPYWEGEKFESENEAKDFYLGKSHLVRRTLVIEMADRTPIGKVEMLNMSWRLHTGEIRVVIADKSMRNQGLGQDAVYTFVKGLFETTSLQEAFLRVDRENHRAIRCYHKVGFRPEWQVRVPREGEEDRSRRLILMTVNRDSLGQLRK